MLILSLFKELESLFGIGLSIYILSFLIQLYFYLNYSIRLSFHQQKIDPLRENSQAGVSLIIAYKNEETNLKRNLPHLLDQDYPLFEIILVNDHSSDHSQEFLESLNDERIRLIDSKHGHGKKAAIQEGIKAAKFDWLLFTDADCQPTSRNWIDLMVSTAEKRTEIVIGYGRFYRRFSLLNLLQRFENAVNSLQNMSFCLKSGRAYMAVGRNLMYRRSLADQLDPEQLKSGEVLSGDDDLLVNQMSNGKNTAINYQYAAQTLSEASVNWSSYFYQKRRQLEAGNHYRSADRLRLAILGMAQLLFNLLLVTFFFTSSLHPLILIIFVLKFGIQLIIYAGAFQKFREFDIWLISPLLEMIYLPIISLIGLSLYLWKVDRWK